LIFDKPAPSINLAPHASGGGGGAPTTDITDILKKVLRRWKLIIFTTVLALVSMHGVLKVLPSLYKSTVEILIFDSRQQVDDAVQKRVTPFDVDGIAMNTEVEIIKSKSLALRVAQDLGLDQDREFQPRSRLAVWAERAGLQDVGWLEARQQTVDDPPAKAQLLDRAAQVLVQNIHVERKPFSYVLEISATSQDPAKSQRLAQTVADDYLASQREARQDALQRVASWLKGRLDDLQSRVLETEASIERLKARSGLSDVGVNQNISEQQISDINKQLTLARAEVVDKRAQVEQASRIVKSGDIQQIPEVMASSVISQLRVQQSELARRQAELSTKLGERHPDVLIVHAQLADINKTINAEAERIIGNMRNAHDSAVRREQSLAEGLKMLTAARGDSADYVKLQQLRRLADADRKLYENYLSQYNELSTRETLQTANARIITSAILPAAPSSPRPMLFYGFSGVLGVGLGVAIAFIRECLQSGVRTGADVEGTFGYPVVGLIPVATAVSRHRRVEYLGLAQSIVEAPRSLFSEPVHAIRIGLKVSHGGQEPKVILITSSIPGEGKSAAAALLAASSAGAGQRTILVDCDLRHRSISDAFAKNLPGLAEILTGVATVAEVAVKNSATGTYVIPAGSPVRNPADLLASLRMRDFIAQLRDDYDYVVLDASPLLPVVDALGLASMADRILMIVEWGRTPRAVVAEGLKLLRPEAHRVAGVVLNKVDIKQFRSSRFGYPYGYYGLNRAASLPARVN